MKRLTIDAAAVKRDRDTATGAAPRRRRSRLAVTIVVAVFSAALAEAAVFRVGNGGAAPCTHASLAAAVAAAAANGSGLDKIYLTAPVTLSTTLDIDSHAVQIYGGYSGCADDTPSGKTTITVQANPGFRIQGGTASSALSLVDLQVIRSGSGGRLLETNGQSGVALYRSQLSGGQAVDGANVWMSDPGTYLYVDEGSSISGGNASGLGGGIFCENGAVVLLVDGLVSSNVAVWGGGLYLDGCTLVSFDTISNNHAYRGGGVYARGGSFLTFTGSRTSPAFVTHNISNTEGGGLYLSDSGTQAFATDTWLTDNQASTAGGAVTVLEHATFRMDAAHTQCGDGICSLVRGNAAIQGGGAFVAAQEGQIEIKRTTLTENHSDDLGGVVVSAVASTVTLESCVVHTNSVGGTGTYFLASYSEIALSFSTVVESVGCCAALFSTDAAGTARLFSNILLANASGPSGGRIFDQPPGLGEVRAADCILRDEATATLPPVALPASYATAPSLDALFVDAAAHDYHLRAGAPAIDFCDTYSFTPTTTDMDREARGYDVPPAGGNPFGPYDLGADEWLGPVFAADFEQGDCSEWSFSTGGC